MCLVEIIFLQNTKQADLRQHALAFDMMAISNKPLEDGK
jgi:hypothetical protein